MPLRALEEKISNPPQFNPGRPLWFYFYLPLFTQIFSPMSVGELFPPGTGRG